MSVPGPTPIPTAAQPRFVPGGVAIAARFGGGGVQFAWGVLALGLALFWWLALDPEFSPLNGLWRLGPTVEVEGVVQSVIETDREKLGRTEWDIEYERVTIPGLHYGYAGPDGAAYTGVAMGLKHGYHQNMAKVGATVPVVYSETHPEKSYVKGLEVEDQAEYILKGAGFWLFAVAGALSLIGVASGLRRGRALTRLLADGEIVRGRIVEISKIPVLSAINVWRLSYELSGASAAQASAWCQVVPDELSDREERILCGTGPTPRIFPLSLTPGRVGIDELDCVIEGTFSPYNYLVLPVLCILGYTWFAMWCAGYVSPPWVL